MEIRVDPPAVLRQVAGMRKVLAARLARKRAAAGVRPQVRRQVAGRRDGLAARRTLVRAVAGVRAHVHRQLAGLREGLATRLAFVRAVAGVREHVPRQLAGLRKGLAACLAYKWAVAGVRAHVRHQAAGPRQGLAAHRALAVLVLGGSDRPFLPGRPTLILPVCMVGRCLLPAALAAERHGGAVAHVPSALIVDQTGQNLHPFLKAKVESRQLPRHSQGFLSHSSNSSLAKAALQLTLQSHLSDEDCTGWDGRGSCLVLLRDRVPGDPGSVQANQLRVHRANDQTWLGRRN